MTTNALFMGFALVAAFMSGLATIAGDSGWSLLFIGAAIALYLVALRPGERL